MQSNGNDKLEITQAISELISLYSILILFGLHGKEKDFSHARDNF